MSEITFSNAAREPAVFADSRPAAVAVHAAARARQQRLASSIVLVPTLGALGALVGVLVGHGPSGLDLALFAGLLFATAVGVELGFHRHFSHAAFRASRSFRFSLIALGSMASQGPLLFWASTHRRHHAFSDRPGDPHSPHRGDRGPTWRGFWHAHVGWLFTHEVTDWARYVPDLARDRKLVTLSQRYLTFVVGGLLFPAVVGGVATGTAWGACSAFLWGGLVRVFVLHHTTWAVNSLCHLFGSRALKTRDRSANLAWLALPSLGGAWHNTHHAFPSLAKNSLRWWQLDPCAWVLTVAEWLGLAWDAHVPNERMRQLVRARSQATASITDEGTKP